MKPAEFIYLGESDKPIFCVDGVDLFKYKWHSFGNCTDVIDPESGLACTLSVYELKEKFSNLVFAAGETRPGHWIFFEAAE